MNTQDMFDKVVNHMREQGNPRGDLFHCSGSKGWAYINSENPCERCAKGILMGTQKIGEGYYTIKASWEKNVELYLGRKLTKTEIWMLNDLEVIFETKDERLWEEDFKAIADRYDLVYTAPEVKRVVQNTLEVLP